MEELITQYKPCATLLPEPGYKQDHRAFHDAALAALRGAQIMTPMLKPFRPEGWLDRPAARQEPLPINTGVNNKQTHTDYRGSGFIGLQLCLQLLAPPVPQRCNMQEYGFK